MHSNEHSSGTAPKMGLGISNAKLCMWLFLGTEIMFFTAFIGTYIVLRLGSPDWPTRPEDTHINVLLGGVNTFVLIVSSYLVVVAHEAMGNKQFKRAWTAMLGTLVLGFVFLGIKATEYKGKFDHDIVPGHIAESDTQALQKLVNELASSRTAMLASLVPAESDSAKQADAVNGEMAQATGDRAELLKSFKLLDDTYGKMKEDVRKGAIKLHSDATDHHTLNPAIQKTIEKLRSDQNVARHLRVHDPHVMVYGNTFASCYFLMTGFHAIHVVIGMLLWVIVLLKGASLDSTWGDYVENSGLYWHFVDLVWIFLFPLLYIVQFS